MPVFEPAPDTVPNSLSVPSSTESDFETLALDLDQSEFDGPHFEIEIDKPAPKAAFAAPAPLAHPAKLLAEARDRYAMGDFSGALVVVETLLEAEPGHGEAQKIAGSCRDVLLQMYSARLGPLSQVASVAIPADQIRWLSLDHRAGFLLSLVDGVSSIERSGRERHEAPRRAAHHVHLARAAVIASSTRFDKAESLATRRLVEACAGLLALQQRLRRSRW